MQRSADWAPTPALDVTVVPRRHDTLLLDADGTTILSLNDTALAIFQLCDGSTTLDEMVDACVALFDIDENAARDQVAAALDRLQRAGVLR